MNEANALTCGELRALMKIGPEEVFDEADCSGAYAELYRQEQLDHLRQLYVEGALSLWAFWELAEALDL